MSTPRSKNLIDLGSNPPQEQVEHASMTSCPPTMSHLGQGDRPSPVSDTLFESPGLTYMATSRDQPPTTQMAYISPCPDELDPYQRRTAIGVPYPATPPQLQASDSALSAAVVLDQSVNINFLIQSMQDMFSSVQVVQAKFGKQLTDLQRQNCDVQKQLNRRLDSFERTTDSTAAMQSSQMARTSLIVDELEHLRRHSQVHGESKLKKPLLNSRKSVKKKQNNG